MHLSEDPTGVNDGLMWENQEEEINGDKDLEVNGGMYC